MSLQEVLPELIGVLGTILGTVLGWSLNMLSQKGKLHIYTSEWRDRFQANQDGEMVDVASREDAEEYSYNLDLDIYNSSSETKIMRDVNLEFMASSQIILTDRPKDDSTRRISGFVSFYDNLEILNIAPKTVMSVHLHGGYWKQDSKDFDKLFQAEMVLLTFRDQNNKVRTFEISGASPKSFFEDSNVSI